VSGVTVMGVVGDSIAIRPSVSRLFTVLRKESQNLLPANKTLLSPYSVSFSMHIDFFYVIIYKSTIFFLSHSKLSLFISEAEAENDVCII